MDRAAFFTGRVKVLLKLELIHCALYLTIKHDFVYIPILNEPQNALL